MSQTLVLKQRQQLTVLQILRVYGKQFKQIQCRYSDGNIGRCAIGVIMSYFGWDGRVETTFNPLVISGSISLRNNWLNQQQARFYDENKDRDDQEIRDKNPGVSIFAFWKIRQQYLCRNAVDKSNCIR
jgi:hypothetical protein